MNKSAAIYARVSSDRQKEDHTIASQTTALVEYAKSKGYVVPPEWVFQDEGYSGASLQRPGLEALRDLAAQGQMATVLIYSPDRLSRKIRLPSVVGGRTIEMWSGHCFSEVALWWQSRGSIGRAVSGNDCR